MGRNFGVTKRDYYTAEEFRDGCWINFIMGTCFGIVFVVGAIAAFGWVHNWYWVTDYAAILDVYTLEEILELNDMTTEEALELFVTQGFLRLPYIKPLEFDD